MARVPVTRQKNAVSQCSFEVNGKTRRRVRTGTRWWFAPILSNVRRRRWRRRRSVVLSKSITVLSLPSSRRGVSLPLPIMKNGRTKTKMRTTTARLRSGIRTRSRIFSARICTTFCFLVFSIRSRDVTNVRMICRRTNIKITSGRHSLGATKETRYRV